MSLAQKNKTAQKKTLLFVTQYHLTLPNLKDTLMGKWHLIDKQPQLREIFKEPPIISVFQPENFTRGPKWLATKPEFLVAKDEMLVISITILSPGMAFKILCLC